MALTKIGTSGIKDDAVTTDKLANAINTERTANTAKDLTALSAANLTSGTIPDARFPATLPAASAANLTAVPAANITGTLPAISATNLTNIPAANITGTLPAISGANLTDLPASGKATNLAINGAMTVAQRLNSAHTSSTSSGYYSVDRYKSQWANTGNTVTQSRSDVASGTTPYTLGFRKALKISMSAAGTTNSNSYIETYQKIEAQNIATSGWNYVSASSNITISFWVKASTNQTFYVRLFAADTTDKTYCFSYTASGNDTWTKITKTVPGNANLVFNNDNGEGLRVQFYMYYGTDYTGTRNLNTWEAAGNPHTPDQATTWYTAGASTWEMTGLQVEVADSASDFAH